MLTLQYIRENQQEVIERLKIKNFDAAPLLQQIAESDSNRRKLQQQADNKQAELNEISRNIGDLFKQGKHQEGNEAKQQTTQIKEEIKQLNQQFAEVDNTLYNLLVQLPNLPHASVPAGKGETDNVIIKEGGKVPELGENPLPHWELAAKYKLIDFELGNKLTGAGFPVYLGKGARLQRALIEFFLEQNVVAGYQEVLPPFVVNEDSAFATGQLPDKEGQMYHVVNDNLYLIPTAEVPVTNLYRNEILNAADLPIKNTAYTPCFRREAGSYGKDVRGLNRLHQFDKVEIVQIQHPDKSYETLDEMVAHVESLLQMLELPYRIVRLCGGDMSFTASLTYDFEVYSAAQDKWLEVSSVSNFESYQANRLKLRFKEDGNKKNVLAHTLNGSALALPRIMASVIENNQTKQGIRIPSALKPFFNYEYIS